MALALGVSIVQKNVCALRPEKSKPLRSIDLSICGANCCIKNNPKNYSFRAFGFLDFTGKGQSGNSCALSIRSIS